MKNNFKSVKEKELEQYIEGHKTYPIEMLAEISALKSCHEKVMEIIDDVKGKAKRQDMNTLIFNELRKRISEVILG